MYQYVIRNALSYLVAIFVRTFKTYGAHTSTNLESTSFQIFRDLTKSRIICTTLKVAEKNDGIIKLPFKCQGRGSLGPAIKLVIWSAALKFRQPQNILVIDPAPDKVALSLFKTTP